MGCLRLTIRYGIVRYPNLSHTPFLREMARLLASLLFYSPVFALVLLDGVGRLPALGWNSWNAYGCDVNETSILNAAESMVSLGLKVSIAHLSEHALCSCSILTLM